MRKLTKALTCLVTAATVLGGLSGPAQALTFLRDIPLEISAYESALAIPETLATADQVLTILNQTDNLLVHMEVIRRAVFQLPQAEAEHLVQAVKDRYLAAKDDPYRYFDHGYVQVVFDQNQSALFFLRKADDAIKSQFTSLAYALAQAEADRDYENRPADEWTIRKQDVVYGLKDAVSRDANNHQPGFWPSFLAVLSALNGNPLYASSLGADFSEEYIPYGNVNPFVRPQPVAVDSDAGQTPVPTPAIAIAQAIECKRPKPAERTSNPAIDWSRHILSTEADLLGTGCSQRLSFFSTDQPEHYRALVLDHQNTILAELQTQSTRNFFEDLENDGVFELVLRQYYITPKEPVVVYRFANGRYERDTTADAFFR